MTVRRPAANGVGAPMTSTPRSPLGAYSPALIAVARTRHRRGADGPTPRRSANPSCPCSDRSARSWDRRPCPVGQHDRRLAVDLDQCEHGIGPLDDGADGGERGDPDAVDVDGGDERGGAVAQRPLAGGRRGERPAEHEHAGRARTNSTIDEANRTAAWSRRPGGPTHGEQRRGEQAGGCVRTSNRVQWLPAGCSTTGSSAARADGWSAGHRPAQVEAPSTRRRRWCRRGTRGRAGSRRRRHRPR